MNLEYISGFFDADGSISLCKHYKTAKFKNIQISFSNTYLEILIEIQKYLKKYYNLSLYISKKSAKKETHKIGYALTCNTNQQCIQLCKLINSNHPMKKHRINTILKYHDKVTKRNGKYSNQEYTRKLAYERLFFSSIFQ